MDKFEIKTAFNRVKYDKKFDPGNMANVNDILCANPMQGVMEQIQDVIHESDLAHDNFIKECIVSVGIDPNALTETAKLNAKLQYELKTLRAEVAREIFEEIEKIIKSPRTVGFCMTAPSFRQAISDYNEGIRKEILYYIAELKKKYTEN